MRRKTIQMLAFLLAVSAPVLGQIKTYSLGVCVERGPGLMVTPLGSPYAFRVPEIIAQPGDTVLVEARHGAPHSAVWVGWAMPANVEQARRVAGQNTQEQ